MAVLWFGEKRGVLTGINKLRFNCDCGFLMTVEKESNLIQSRFTVKSMKGAYQQHVRGSKHPYPSIESISNTNTTETITSNSSLTNKKKLNEIPNEVRVYTFLTCVFFAFFYILFSHVH